MKGVREHSYIEFSNFCNNMSSTYKITINGVDVTVTRKSENSYAFKSYVWDNMKGILEDCSDNKSKPKLTKKRRKLCQGNFSRGDDGFNKLHILRKSDEQTAAEEAANNTKDTKSKINRIGQSVQTIKDSQKNVEKLRQKDPTKPEYFDISDKTHHDVLSMFLCLCLPCCGVLSKKDAKVKRIPLRRSH
eukprot:14790911-Ditylum_brightwellii.AAC.1